MINFGMRCESISEVPCCFKAGVILVFKTSLYKSTLFLKYVAAPDW